MTGADHALPSNAACQIFTSRAPSALPPNHAARSLPGAVSTTVEAWHEGNGALSKMSMGRVHRGRGWLFGGDCTKTSPDSRPAPNRTITTVSGTRLLRQA